MAEHTDNPNGNLFFGQRPKNLGSPLKNWAELLDTVFVFAEWTLYPRDAPDSGLPCASYMSLFAAVSSSSKPKLSSSNRDEPIDSFRLF